MRFLIDNALSPLVSERLKEAGFDVLHVREVVLQDAPDEEIFQFAVSTSRTIISADTDFATIIAHLNQAKPSIILFRRFYSSTPEEQASILILNLQSENLQDAISDGAVIIIERERIRIRKLPIHKP